MPGGKGTLSPNNVDRLAIAGLVAAARTMRGSPYFRVLEIGERHARISSFESTRRTLSSRAWKYLVAVSRQRARDNIARIRGKVRDRGNAFQRALGVPPPPRLQGPPRPERHQQAGGGLRIAPVEVDDE